MGTIVAGFATSHSPMLNSPPERWSETAKHLIDYQPYYRTEAGTGCATGFAYWS